MVKRIALAATVAAGALAVAGPAAAATDPGASVFTANGCAACHTLAVAKASGKIGPNLDKTKPSQAKVISIVTKGKGAMPAFKGRLSTAQIKAVATYISKNAGKKK
jgi:mono/diheme cytochrome c family protein